MSRVSFQNVKKWMAITAMVLFFFGLSQANTYYVDENSIGGPAYDSNPGTIDQPWATIQKANQTLHNQAIRFISGLGHTMRLLNHSFQARKEIR